MPYIRLSKLTQEQRDLVELTYEAKQLLQDNGFDCVVEEYFVTSPKDCAAGIKIIKKLKA